ncbi:hypothetical protein N8291_05560 [Pseudomonadales bacterium]|nr:hypothetical protein [Pseudomonadales bacterium]MDC3343964.1 hypothetical protein [Pseudomonadales bacterium]
MKPAPDRGSRVITISPLMSVLDTQPGVAIVGKAIKSDLTEDLV